MQDNNTSSVNSFIQAAAALFLLLFLGAYFSSLKILAVHWSGLESASYSHGFLVLACVLYLLYLRKDRLGRTVPRPAPLALFPLALGSLLWLVGRVGDIQALQLAVLPVVLLCAIAAVFGYAILRLTFVPVSLLFFAIPMWQPLLPLLQDITTAVTHFNLNVLGKPVFVEGNVLHLPGGSFLIEESCSGLRFLLVSGTLGIMNSAMNGYGFRQGMLSMALIAILAFFANWVRVFAIVLIGDHTNMQSSLVEDHANFGWMIYLIFTLVPFFLISRFLFDDGSSVDSPSRIQPPATGSRYATVLLAGFMLVSGPLLYMTFERNGDFEHREVAVLASAGSWRSAAERSSPGVDDWTPSFQGASEHIFQAFSSDARKSERIQLHIVFYRMQEQGAELINANNQLVDEEGWFARPGSEEILSMNLDSGIDDIAALEVESAKGRRKKVWYWYNVGGWNTVNPYLAKLLQVVSLFNGRRDASLFALATDCGSDCSRAESLLQDFLQDMDVFLQAAI